MIEEESKHIERIIEDRDNDLPCHDVWNWESEHGAWIKAMKQAGLDKDTIWKVIKKRDKTINLHPADAAEIWWKFKDRDK